MDKRMSYNLRLMGSVFVEPNTVRKTIQDERLRRPIEFSEDKNKKIELALKNMSVMEKKAKIVPKIKKLQDFVLQKLELDSEQDRENIEQLKNRLQSID